CVAPVGTTQFFGPYFALNGDTSGISYAQVSNYQPIPLSAVDVRVVAAPATDCSTPLFADVHNQTLTAGIWYTAAMMGEATASPNTLQLKSYVDDTTETSGMVKLRFVHAAPGQGALDVGVEPTAGQFVSLFANVTYSNFGSGTGVNPGG